MTTGTQHHRANGAAPRGGSYVALSVLVSVLLTLVVLIVILPDTIDNAVVDDQQSRIDLVGQQEGDVATGARRTTTMTGSGGGIVSRASHLRQSLKHVVSKQRAHLAKALSTLTEGNVPTRLHRAREKHQIIGERLAEVRAGKETVEEILHAQAERLRQMSHDHTGRAADLPPMTVEEITDYLNKWLRQLHETLGEAKHAEVDGIWQAYHDLTVKTLYPWDQEYLKRMPTRRDDGSIFLSLATYRDENCYNTLYNAYAKSKNPANLFVGLIQQNCHHGCKSGVLANLTMVDVPPDDNCYELFCASDIGQEICHRKQVRLLDVDEPESLGPYAARYFASKLWNGEQWFMQTDAHMTFATHWDGLSIEMLEGAPSEKPILSHYPPAHTVDLDSPDFMKKPGARLCGPIFATSDLESQMIRLEGAGFDKEQPPACTFAPFTAAGYFVAHSDFLREVPFDPFLPWIFMGEEIIMSSRLWTSGYDIFGPRRAVVGHMYVRRHTPKFWEATGRSFNPSIHNPLQMLVLDRIKYQLGYPESAADMIQTKSVLTAVEQYSMGTQRPLETYLKTIGLNMTTKEVTNTKWCEEGRPPPGFEQYNDLYPSAKEEDHDIN